VEASGLAAGRQDEFWILNAERALASLEETGAALTGMAGGNSGCWIGREDEAAPPGSLLAFSSPMAMANVPFITKNRHFYSLKNFAPLRLCARKLLIGIEWIGSMVLSCQRCRGVKIASRKGAKAQRKMQLMVDW